MSHAGRLLPVVLGFGLVFAPPGAAQPPQQTAAETAAITRGAGLLRGRAGSGRVGEGALMALALIKGDVPAKDPALEALLARVRRQVSGSVYTPELGSGVEIYE